MQRRMVLAALGGIASAGGLVYYGRSSPQPDPTETPTPADRTPQTPSPTAEPTPEPKPYDTELNVVTDLGCSPDGDESCTDRLTEALADRTLFRFPAGEYRFDAGLFVREFDWIGFAGAPDADVTLVPPDGFNSTLIDVEAVGQVLFRDIDIDLSAPDTTAGVRCISDDGFHVENVTVRGRGTHPSEDVTNAFLLAVKNPDAAGVLRDVVARQGSAIGHYKGGNGRVGVWVGGAHRGTAMIESCEFSEFGNNGVYASRNPGIVHVIGGTYRNNNVSAVRLSGAESYVRDATMEVNFESYEGPRTRIDESFWTGGVVVEQGPYDKERGVVVQNCTIDIENRPNPRPAVSVWPTGKTVTVVDSTLRVRGNSPVVSRRGAFRQGRHDPTTGARWIELDGCTVDGDSEMFPLVDLNDAAGSFLRESTFTHASEDGDGVGINNSPRTVFDRTTIDVDGYPIVIEGELSARDACDCLLLFTEPPDVSTSLPDQGETRVPLGHCQSTTTPTRVRLPAADDSTCLTTQAIRSDDYDGFVGLISFSDERVVVDFTRESEGQ